MTNKEAIEKLERHKMMNCHGCVHPSMVGWCEDHCQLPKAFDMAINALIAQDLNKQVTGKLNSADDTISRQAAIDAVEWGITLAIAVNTTTGEKRQLFREGNNALRKAAERIKELPPVQAEIIRCKECVHADIFYHCDYMTTWHDGECFCSHGKRRTDGRSNQKTGCD